MIKSFYEFLIIVNECCKSYDVISFTTYNIDRKLSNQLFFLFFYFRCPVDWEIMGEFEYSSSKTTAIVHFQAHKFPYTSSVYYQCNVRLCIRHAGGCEDTVSHSEYYVIIHSTSWFKNQDCAVIAQCFGSSAEASFQNQNKFFLTHFAKYYYIQWSPNQ